MMNAPTTRVPTARPLPRPARAPTTVPEISWPSTHGVGKRTSRLDDVQVGVADAAGCHLDEDLAPPGPRDGNPLNLERHPRGRKHRCQHRLRHLPGQLNPSVPAGLC